MHPPIPVTVLTGFLGAGKTTLLNRILREHHGQRIAVVENEFGEIGVDHELVIDADEEIFEMNNGCICCTVRGDLIRILGSLARRRDRFDRVIVETTGLADPGPVAQTFFVDPDIQRDFALDGVVTVVDAVNALRHLDESAECQEQIGFADVLLLNKCDQATPEGLGQLERRLQGMNAAARIHRTVLAEVPLGEVLSLGGFDLDRALQREPAFLEPEYPFEWTGIFELQAGVYTLQLGPGADPAVDLWLEPADAGPEAVRRAAEATLRWSAKEPLPARELAPGVQVRQALGQRVRLPVIVPRAGCYALHTEHRPDELDLVLADSRGKALRPSQEQVHDPDHVHDDTVGSVAVSFAGALDGDRLMLFVRTLLREQGQDLFRMKGLVEIAGRDERFVFQSVHMLFDAKADRPWGPGPRKNTLVFIGRDLDRAELEAGLRACRASAP
jgi:G3E family GTPase